MDPIDVPEELRALSRSYASFVSLYRADTDALCVQAEVSAWSLGQHLYHLCLSGDLALRNVLTLARGRGRRIVHGGGPNALARRVLREGCYPRGESQAPRMVQPPDPVDPALLDQEIDLFGRAIAGLGEHQEAIRRATGRIPHQNLGHLSAPQWLRFAHLHAQHHLAIARDLAQGRG